MKTIKLGSLITISKGKKHTVSEVPSPQSIRMLGIDDLRNDTLIRMTDDQDGVLACDDDVLIAWDGANAGTIGYGKRGYIGSTISRLRLHDTSKFYAPFIGMFLQSNFSYLRQTATGATIPHINRNALERIPVPVFAYDDQIRIATLLSKVENLISRRREQLKQLDELLKSVFLEMFGDPVRNEKGWKKKKIIEFACVKIGPFGSLLHASDYISKGIPLINPSHIVNGEIRPDYSLTITSKKFDELTSYHLSENDIVVARRGEIGRCALVRDKAKLLCGTGSMFIRIESQYVPDMLQFQIFTTSLKDLLVSKAKGVTMKNLNSTTLETLQVICPPLELQIQFATIIKKVDSIKSYYQQSLTTLENLYGVLSQKAFKGELDLSRVLVGEVMV